MGESASHFPPNSTVVHVTPRYLRRYRYVDKLWGLARYCTLLGTFVLSKVLSYFRTFEDITSYILVNHAKRRTLVTAGTCTSVPSFVRQLASYLRTKVRK